MPSFVAMDAGWPSPRSLRHCRPSSLSLSWPDHKQSFRPVPAVKLLGIVFPPLFTLFQPKMVGVISPSLIEMPLGGSNRGLASPAGAGPAKSWAGHQGRRETVPEAPPGWLDAWRDVSPLTVWSILFIWSPSTLHYDLWHCSNDIMFTI